MVNIPQRVLGEALERSSERFPSKTAIIIKSREYEYSALYRNAVRLAAHLVRSGTKKGDRIAVYMSNSWECIIAIYAISLSGAAFMVINPQTRSDKLEYILNDSGARILISESFLGSELSEALKGSSNVNEIIVTGKGEKLSLSPEIKLTLFEDAIDAKNSDTPLPRVIPNDLAALIYTSGSTGFPKGVMMTHQSMVFAAWSLIEYLRLTEEDRLILLLPLAFDYGLYQLIMSVTIGGSIIVEQSFTFQASVYRQMEAYRPTVFPGVTTI
jgi:long-chain acyl-CoA synthetase